MRYEKQTQQLMFATIVSWQQSGLSQKAYCEQNNIRYHVFHYWYKCYRDDQTPKSNPGFVQLTVKPAASLNTYGSPIELLLPDGKRLLFHQAVSSDYLKALIS